MTNKLDLLREKLNKRKLERNEPFRDKTTGRKGKILFRHEELYEFNCVRYTVIYDDDYEEYNQQDFYHYSEDNESHRDIDPEYCFHTTLDEDDIIGMTTNEWVLWKLEN
jgi:hypothetical protein